MSDRLIPIVPIAMLPPSPRGARNVAAQTENPSSLQDSNELVRSSGSLRLLSARNSAVRETSSDLDKLVEGEGEKTISFNKSAFASLTSNTFTVTVEGFKVNSGLVLSYTVYSIRWRFLPTNDSNVVDHRYSDFLTLSEHLKKAFPSLVLPEFPEKRRFVIISDRTSVASERLDAFRVWTKVFESCPELWLDAKVQRFFNLPDELRQSNSARRSGRQVHTIRGGIKSTKRKGHRRTGSEMTFPVSFVAAKRDSERMPQAAWQDELSGDGEIRRSGSDMYLNKALLGELASTAPDRTTSAFHIESTPELRRVQNWNSFQRKSSTEEEMNTPPKQQLRRSAATRPMTPPHTAGDISPVFARKGLAVVDVPQHKMQDERIRQLSDFQIQALLGRGGFGSVFLATELTTGLVVAIKRMAKSTIKRKKVEHVKMELGVLKKARIKQNRWIVQLHYSFQDEHYLYLAMQYCPGGDLRHLMENCEFDETTVRLFAAEMCVCVHQLHAMNVVHRDLVTLFSFSLLIFSNLFPHVEARQLSDFAAWSFEAGRFWPLSVWILGAKGTSEFERGSER